MTYFPTSFILNDNSFLLTQRRILMNFLIKAGILVWLFSSSQLQFLSYVIQMLLYTILFQVCRCYSNYFKIISHSSMLKINYLERKLDFLVMIKIFKSNMHLPITPLKLVWTSKISQCETTLNYSRVVLSYTQYIKLQI